MLSSRGVPGKALRAASRPLSLPRRLWRDTAPIEQTVADGDASSEHREPDAETITDVQCRERCEVREETQKVVDGMSSLITKANVYAYRDGDRQAYLDAVRHDDVYIYRRRLE